MSKHSYNTMCAACTRNYPPSECTLAFVALDVSNKHLYEVSHQTLEYLKIFQFGVWQHELMWVLNTPNDYKVNLCNIGKHFCPLLVN